MKCIALQWWVTLEGMGSVGKSYQVYLPGETSENFEAEREAMKERGRPIAANGLLKQIVEEWLVRRYQENQEDAEKEEGEVVRRRPRRRRGTGSTPMTQEEKDEAKRKYDAQKAMGLR